MASIVCPSCTLPVPLDDVDLATKLAKCRRCESVFDFAAQVRTPQQEARRRRELVPPAGYTITSAAPPDASRAGYRDSAEARGPTVIQRRWWTWRSLFPSILLAVIGAWSLGIGSAMLASPRREVGELVMALVCATPGILAFATLAESASDPRLVLVAGLPTDEGARFVARAIADRLSLPDPD